MSTNIQSVLGFTSDKFVGSFFDSNEKNESLVLRITHKARFIFAALGCLSSLALIGSAIKLGLSSLGDWSFSALTSQPLVFSAETLLALSSAKISLCVLAGSLVLYAGASALHFYLKKDVKKVHVM